MLYVSCMQLTRALLNQHRCVPKGDRHVSVNIPLMHSYEHIKFSKSRVLTTKNGLYFNSGLIPR